VDDEKNDIAMNIETTVADTVDDASASFTRRNSNPDGEVEVAGDWELAVTYPSADDPTMRYFKVLDENLIISLICTVGPPDAVSDDEVVELLTTYAEQVLTAYRA